MISVSVAPLNDDGYAMVGVSSNLTATIANVGVRDMTASEGSKLEVAFYTAAPMSAKLVTVNVDRALAMGESVDVSIPFTFSENAQYRFVVKVDEDKLIDEEDTWNNENFKNSGIATINYLQRLNVSFVTNNIDSNTSCKHE